MDMICGTVYFQRGAVKAPYYATEIVMQSRAKLGGNQRQTILSSVNNVIEQIRVRHDQILMHESSTNSKIDLLRCVEELGKLDSSLQGISRRSAALNYFAGATPRLADSPWA
jgi:hypothetical protein